jgi:transposase
VKESQSDKYLIRECLQNTKTKQEFKRVLCIWLSIALGLKAKDIALALDMTPAAVRKFHSRYYKSGAAIFAAQHPGGRRKAYLDKERETKLMKTFLRWVQSGKTLNVAEVQSAYERSAGRQVSRSTIYRLIERYGMRRFLPKVRLSKN